MDNENCAGKIVLYVDEEGNPTGKGHYQRWDDLDINGFKRASEHAVAWSAIPHENVDRLVRTCLGIPVIGAG